MRGFSPWAGVRLASFAVGVDPDAEPHPVLVPIGWGEPAARGLLALAGPPGGGRPLRLPEAAERWIGPLDRRARAAGYGDELGMTLHHLLLLRQACPDGSAWATRGAGTAPAEEEAWRFVLHLAAFADPETGLDGPCLESAVEALTLTASLGQGSAAAVIRIAGLDGMLAALGLPYASEAGRDLAADTLRLLRRAAGTRTLVLEAGPAGPAEALLGVETAGIAPAFAPIDERGALTDAARSRLAALGLTAEDALARTLAGDGPLTLDGPAELALMRDAVLPLLDRAPPPTPPGRRPTLRAVAGAGSPGPHGRPLPARANGFTQKVTIGGHRVFVRTGEFADGSLGEVSITAGGRDGANARGLAEAVSQAISIGLQHGVPLDVFVEAFAHARFGPSGAVEGDGAIAVASSPLDYAVRALSEAYGGRHVPDPEIEMPDNGTVPLLPLVLPVNATTEPRQRTLRLVRA